MQVNDEMLMAYADGELDAVQSAAVKQAVAADPVLAERVAQHHKLRSSLHVAFEGILSETVPQRLLQALRPQRQAAPQTRAMTDVQQWLRHQKELLFGNWAWPQWSAVAASLAVGGLLGMLVMNRDGGLIGNRSGQLLARGALSAALDTQGSGAHDSSIQLNLSFRNKSGEYCRTFVISQSQAMAGLACRRGSEWQLDTLSATGEVQGSGLRQAGTNLPAAVLDRVTEQIDGEPLDAEGEALALKRGWR